MFFVIARMISLLLALVVVPTSLLLLAVGQSLESKAFGIAWLVIGGIPLIACLIKESGSKKAGWVVVPGFVIAAILLVWLGIQSPDGRLVENSRVQYRFVRPQTAKFSF